MKTIQVTDEQYEQLKHMAELMVSQDNRATGLPLYCVYEKEERYSDRGGECRYVNCDYDEIYAGEDEIIEAFKNKEEFLAEYNLLSEEDYDKVGPDSAEEIAKLLDLELVYYDVVNVPVSGQTYFTEDAAQKHIDSNGYHYKQPFIYVESAWRNPEMQLLREVVMSLVEKEEVTT